MRFREVVDRLMGSKEERSNSVARVSSETQKDDLSQAGELKSRKLGIQEYLALNDIVG
ncbi:hypothetical protein [Acidianus sp. RZ1]|uniref:hypothetical protein n=1 Tax=Acidianus sp. RZ1 TaxID=1540082 RepID=UPI001492D462|nr:hypothetical protein [Acidianus sp. RZ1]NON61652.1 hypothetical protein [Acidianus sp. RZ1]